MEEVHIMESVTFKTNKGTEIEVRNIATPLGLDILQAAANLIDGVEDLVQTEEVDRETGVMLHAPMLAGGSLGLYIPAVDLVDQDDEIEPNGEQSGQYGEELQSTSTKGFDQVQAQGADSDILLHPNQVGVQDGYYRCFYCNDIHELPQAARVA